MALLGVGLLSPTLSETGGRASVSCSSSEPLCPQPPVERSIVSMSSSVDICRICHGESESKDPLLSPCYCSGSMLYVHNTCLQKWIQCSRTRACNLCGYRYKTVDQMKPLSEWSPLDLEHHERRKICYSLVFHVIALSCVVWSLLVLLKKTADDVALRDFRWPFWTKLTIFGLGVVIGCIFMYTQCRFYCKLALRLREHNRVVRILNAPFRSANSNPV